MMILVQSQAIRINLLSYFERSGRGEPSRCKKCFVLGKEIFLYPESWVLHIKIEHLDILLSEINPITQ